MPSLPKKPKHPYDPAAASIVLSAADSYLAHAGDLIYSFGRKTFLSGYALFDEEYGGRGNIDCSTFVLLALAGIPYEKSPYASGTVKGLENAAAVRLDTELVDFSSLPDRFVGVAERIGYPELAGPRGLDLNKMTALGIDPEEIWNKIRESGVVRWSVHMAEYYAQRGECFTDSASLCPGDIVFYRSSGIFREGEQTYQGYAGISHVGIVYYDTKQMINSSGVFGKQGLSEETVPAISTAEIYGTRTPAFFARGDRRDGSS